MKSELRAYLAGLLDGEGTIGFCSQIAKPHWKNKNCDHLRLQVDVISNTNEALIIAVVNLLKADGFSPKVSHWQPEGAKSKQGHRIYLPCIEERRSFLELVHPYLIGKKEQAEIGLEFLSRRSVGKKVKTTEYERLLHERMKVLNQRGHTSEPVTTERPAGDTPKSQSELHGDVQSAAEMPAPAKIN